ncbi:unnamed protein product [Mytilus coruscus]|uniref:Uncharacterized protein n=1 Tax=Mytilus coruscus TaxID=42192 RepID=A0A6J8EXY1_MYTCO|nr:unnamed protein product [Mytilus coruscus]
MRNVIQSFFLGRPSLSFKPLEWMIKTFKDQELDDVNFILRTACKYQMFDTVKYLASGCKRFDNISCPQAFVNKSNGFNDKCPFNQELFQFLLTKIDLTSKELIPVVMTVIKKQNVPDYMFDAFLPVCLNNAKLLTLACENGQFYLVNLIIESSRIVHLDIQSALIAACKETKSHSSDFLFHYKADVEVEKACSSKKLKVIEWFVQNIYTTRLDVYTIIKSALLNKRSDMLKPIMNKIEIESLDKREVLKYITEYYTDELSTTILEIVRTIWETTEDKKVLHMEEIVSTAYKRNFSELFIWIHENCHPHTSIDSKKVLVVACGDCRLDVAKSVVKAWGQTSLDIHDIDGGTLFMIACSTKFVLRYDIKQEYRKEMVNKLKDTLNWILATFQIKRSDIISGVLKLIGVDKGTRNDLHNVVISILETYLNCLKTEDVEKMRNKSLKQKTHLNREVIKMINQLPV